MSKTSDSLDTRYTKLLADGKAYGVTIPNDVAKKLHSKEWGGNERISRYANSDNKKKEKAKKDRWIGNLGEATARRVLKELGYKCKRLSLETKKRGKWRDDLKTDPPCSFVHQNKEYVTESDVMVKATTESMALSVGGASWTIQKADPSKNRQADPLLDNPNANILMAAVLLMENGKSIEQQLADGDDLYAEVYFFYWPLLFPNLKLPYHRKYHHCKRVFYLAGNEHAIVMLNQHAIL